MSSPPAWARPMDEEGQRQGGSQVAPKTPRDSLMSVPAHVAAAQNSHPSPPGCVYSLSRRFQIVIAGSSLTSVLPPAICKAAQPWPRTRRITAQRPRVTIPPTLLQSAQKEKKNEDDYFYSTGCFSFISTRFAQYYLATQNRSSQFIQPRRTALRSSHKTPLICCPACETPEPPPDAWQVSCLLLLCSCNKDGAIC